MCNNRGIGLSVKPWHFALFLLLTLAFYPLKAESPIFTFEDDPSGLVLQYHGDKTTVGLPSSTSFSDLTKPVEPKKYRLSVLSMPLDDPYFGPQLFSKAERLLSKGDLDQGKLDSQHIGLPDVMVELVKAGGKNAQIWYMFSQFEYGIVGFSRHLLCYTDSHLILLTLDPGPFRKEIVNFYYPYFGGVGGTRGRPHDRGWIKDHRDLAEEVTAGRWSPRLKDLEEEFQFILHSMTFKK